MTDCGIEYKWADECFEAGAYEEEMLNNYTPEDLADDEMSCWVEN